MQEYEEEQRIVVVLNVPHEINYYIDTYIKDKDILIDFLTRILQDKIVYSYPLVDDAITYILGKIAIYAKELLCYGDEDKIFAKGIMLIIESFFNTMVDLGIDDWSYILVSDLTTKALELIVYLK